MNKFNIINMALIIYSVATMVWLISDLGWDSSLTFLAGIIALVMNFSLKKKYTKENIKILFVDDEDMPIVQSLKNAGYSVDKMDDVMNANNPIVESSNIIFVDFNGVGSSFSDTDQGASLIKELRAVYGKSKFIILYSAGRRSKQLAESALNNQFDYADSVLKKNADLATFTDEIRKALIKLNK